MSYLLAYPPTPDPVETGATLYMGAGETYTSLATAFAAMASGDTLIIRDGTYTGTNNQIRYNNAPPSGAAGDYTIVRAEHPGSVIFDGETARTMFDFTGTTSVHHVDVLGLQFVRPSASYEHTLAGTAHNNRTAHHWKFRRCGWQHTMGTTYCSYVLFEDCYVTGQGRYPFIAFVGDHHVFRRCVARLDAGAGGGMPIAHYCVYTSTDTEFQNCLALDSDDQYYSDYEGVYGGIYVRGPFTVSGTTYTSDRTKVRGLIVLNVQHDIAGTGSPSEAFCLGFQAADFEIEHSILWDVQRAWLCEYATYEDAWAMRHCVVGVAPHSDGSTYPGVYTQSAALGDVRDSIFYQITNPGAGTAYAASSLASLLNCAFSGNDNTHTGIGTVTGDITAVDPLAASLLYLPRIETGSALAGAASDSGDVGATIVKRYGWPGTLWGETGYNTLTATNLWPWPDEAIIRTFFRTYGQATPDPTRGFCATDQTLTKYVWGYLGNGTNGY